MSFTRVTLAIGVLLAVAVAAPEARAAGGAIEAQAKKNYQQGKDLLEKGRYKEALEEFDAGYKLTARPLFLFNMAECLRLDGNMAKAKPLYERYLREDPQGRMVDLARGRLAALSAPEVKEVSAKVEPISLAPDAGTAAPLPAKEASVATTQQTQLDLTKSPPTAAPRPKRTWPIWVGVTVGLVVAGAVVTGAVLGTQSSSSSYPSSYLQVDWAK